MKIVIMDLDGVICDNSHRAHLVPLADQQHLNEAWQPFVAECHNDAPIAAGIEMLKALETVYGVAIVTSRQEMFKELTETWLKKHTPFYKCFQNIAYRPADNTDSPAEYKRVTLQLIRSYGHEVMFAIDDDPAIVAMYNAEGVPTFQPSTRCSSCA